MVHAKRRLITSVFHNNIVVPYVPGVSEKLRGIFSTHHILVLVPGVLTCTLRRLNSSTQKASSSGKDSAVHLHLRDKGHSFEDNNVHILDQEIR